MDCNEIDKRLEALRQTADLLRRQIVDDEAILEIAKQANKPAGKRQAIKLKSYTGDDITLDPSEFIDHANDIAIRAGSEEIRQMVREGFGLDSGKPPLKVDGRRNRYINYSKLDPSQANVAGVLEAFAAHRGATPKGKALKEAFTQRVALQSLLAAAKESGSDPAALLKWMTQNTKGIDKLPAVMVNVQRAKMDSAAVFTDLIDEAASQMEAYGKVSAQTMIELGNAGKWTHAFEALDSAMATRVGQALSVRRGDFQAGLKEALEGVDEGLKNGTLVDLDSALRFDDVPRGSLLAQVMESIKTGDPQHLKRIATAKRIMPNRSIKQPDFFTSMELLNKVRKDNLFTSVATWAVRNPAATLVHFYMGLEDVVEGGLRVGVMDGLRATGYGSRAMIKGMGAGAFNALDALRFGKQTYAVKNASEVNLQSASALKQEMVDGVNWAWQGIINSKGLNYVDWWNLVNYGFRRVVGEGLDLIAPGQSVSYYASFRLMQGYDEFLRKGAFDWKVNHEAHIRAAQESKDIADFDDLTREQWIDKRAEQMTEGAVFDGVMNDDDLAKLRSREISTGPGADNIDNDTLRLKVFNELHGVPNMADELGAMGVKRGDDVTFTGDWSNNVERGLALARNNPLASFFVPVLKSPVKGMGWLYNRDVWLRVANSISKEISNNTIGKVAATAMGKPMPKGNPALTPEVMATARARTIVSVGMSSTVWMLWQAGIIPGGRHDRKDPNQRERENRNRGRFSVAYTPDGVQGTIDSIDLGDLMLLQADIFQAWQDSSLTDDAMGWASEQIMRAYALTMGRKSAFDGVIDLIEIMTGQQEGGLPALLASMHSGLIPASGVIGNMVRAGRDPNERRAKRRWLTKQEMAALDKKDDAVWGIYKTTMEFLDRATWNTPFYTGYTDRDWLGLNIERVNGIPTDQTIPFMPVKRPADGTFRWLEKHGFSDKPRKDGSASSFVQKAGVEARIQMTNDEEGVYREQMRTLKGEADSAVFMGKAANSDAMQALGGLDKFVNGNTLHEALTALRLDETYAALLASPVNNPSRVEGGKFDLPLSERTNQYNDPGGLYDPIKLVIDYYDMKGMAAMAQDPEVGPGFKDRVKKTAVYYQQKLNEGIQAAPLGLGRQ